MFPTEVPQAKGDDDKDAGMIYQNTATVDGKTKEQHFLKTVPEVAALMPSRWAYEGLIAIFPKQSRWLAAEQVEYVYRGWKNAATVAENTVATTDDAKDLIHSITGLVGDLNRRSNDLSERYQTQVNLQIFGNDKASKIWDRPHETLLARFKTIPFINVVIATEWYNAAVLALMTLLTLVVSRLLLSSWAQAVVAAGFGVVAGAGLCIVGKAVGCARGGEVRVRKHDRKSNLFVFSGDDRTGAFSTVELT